MKTALNEIPKYIPCEELYQCHHINTTNEEYDFMMNNLDKIVDKADFMKFMSNKQIQITPDYYDNLVKMFESPDDGTQYLAIVLMSSFCLSDENNKPYIESLTEKYGNILMKFKDSDQTFYLTKNKNEVMFNFYD